VLFQGIPAALIVQSWPFAIKLLDPCRNAHSIANLAIESGESRFMANEFQVNIFESEWQDQPQILGFADGSFVVMWRSFDFERSTYFIGARRYDATGNAVGTEFVVDYVEGSASEVSNITLLKDGGFVVTFAYSNGGLLEPDEVYAKIYNADFTVRKDAFKVDTVVDFQSINSNTLALGDGGFIVFYDSDEARSTFDDIYGQRYDRLGNAIGGNFLLNTIVREFDQNIAETMRLTNGNSLVVWHSEASIDDGTFNAQNEFRGTIFSPTGTVIKADFGIGIAQGGAGDDVDPFDVIATRNGGFAIARYETEMTATNDFTYDVKLRLFNSIGGAVTPEITVHAATEGIIYDIDMTQLETGEIVVIWETPAAPFGTYYRDIQARIYDAFGRPLTGVFDIAQDRINGQEEAEITALGGGGFVVTYMSEQIDADNDGIAARIFGRGTANADVVTVDVTGMFSGLGGNDRITGDARANLLNGGADNDVLNGLGGADIVYGGAGNDLVNGGAGADRMAGGAGNDLYGIDNAADVISEAANAGLDRVNSYLSYVLGANLETLALYGAAANATGNALANSLFGNALGNSLRGEAGNDRLDGGAGNDYLRGGRGIDVLAGGAGRDGFVFDTAAITAESDTITDFVAADDTIWLDNAVFPLLGAAGALNPVLFKTIGAGGVLDGNDLVAYDVSTGRLYADLNGGTAGGWVQLATLTGRPALTAADFVVF
jgi:Ca2+-binding RTX toxin-like protein